MARQYVHISTQSMENYGAHEGDGDQHYWKFKGGSDYIISYDPAQYRMQDCVALLQLRLAKAQTNMYYMEFVKHWEEVPEGFKSELAISFAEYGDGDPDIRRTFEQLLAELPVKAD